MVLVLTKARGRMIRIFFFLLTIPFNVFQGHQIGCLNSMPNQCNLSQIVSNHAVFAIYIRQRTKKNRRQQQKQ